MNKYYELAVETLENSDELLEEVLDETLRLSEYGYEVLEARELAYAKILGKILIILTSDCPLGRLVPRSLRGNHHRRNKRNG